MDCMWIAYASLALFPKLYLSYSFFFLSISMEFVLVFIWK